MDRQAGEPRGSGAGLHEPREPHSGAEATTGSGVIIRLSLLQFRTQAIIAAATLTAFAVLLAVTGPHLASIYAADGLDSCHGGGCAELADDFTGSLIYSPYNLLWLLGEGIILLTPAVIGLFWGAPLIARELETETSALALAMAGSASAGSAPAASPDPASGLNIKAPAAPLGHPHRPDHRHRSGHPGTAPRAGWR
jgi:hypothetical protein